MHRFHFNHLKLNGKLTFIYIVCVFIPIILTNIVFYNVTTNNIKRQKTVDAEQALTQLKNELGMLIDDAASISYLYSIDKSLEEHLETEYASYDRYIESLNSIKNIFIRSDKEYKTISSAHIMTDNPTILASGNILNLDQSIYETDWYRSIEHLNNSYPNLYVTPSSISVIQKLSDKRIQKYEHLIKIDLNMEYVNQLMSITTFDGDIYFLSPDGQVRYSNNSSAQQAAQPLEKESIKQPALAITFEQIYQNNRYLGGWSLYGVLDEAKILSEVRQSGQFIVWLAAINFFIPTLIILLISRSITSRIKHILKHMKKVKGKNFKPVPYHSERDEIGELSVEFNRMIERIENLINDVYVADIQKKDLEIRQRQAQLHALHSQINPHFLFNALETIRMRSLMKGETETAKTIQNMAKIFRKSISWKRSFVTIREEIDLIESFLEIQKYRFANKLQYQITVEESLKEKLIPKMTFLPFVENASIHGIEDNPGIGFITIQIASEANQIVFIIADNGMGMSKEQLDELHNYFTEDESMGESVGMKNVYTRLKIVYGDAFTYKIDSELGQGTRITLRLPIRDE